MSKPTIDEIADAAAPIMWAYGLAVYHAQMFEGGARRLLSVSICERKKERLSATDVSIDNLQNDKRLRRVFQNALKLEHFTEIEKRKVDKAIDTRNRLVHAYWDEKHIKAALTPKGREWLVSDLLKLKEQFREADRIMTSLIDQYLSQYGTSLDAFSPPISEIWQSDEEPPDDVLQ